MDNNSNNGVPQIVLDLVSQRTAAKDAKAFSLANTMRNQIMELGYIVQDGKNDEPITTSK